MENSLMRKSDLTDALKNCLEKGDRFELMEFRSKIDFAVIVKSNEPNFVDLKRDWGFKALGKQVMNITTVFLQSVFPEQISMAADIAALMLEKEPTWTLLDVVNFHKTVINRQDMDEFKIFGNKITLLKISEMISAYEGLKADERERFWAQKKFTNPMKRESTDTSIKALMGKELERIQIRDDDKKAFDVPADEHFFNPTID